MEPKLPKLPKSKIKPNIQPNKIIGGGKVTYGGAKSRGVNPLIRNITSSDNLFTQLRERNPEVSNKRGTRTLFNMLGTFGTERNEKIIRKNLQLLRNTQVETFEIAKLLRMNAADGAGGSGGKNYSGALLVGTLAATAGLTLPKLLGGNDDKTKSSTFINLAQINGTDNEKIELTHEDPPFINNFDNRTRAFVQIQNGCDHRCTFCIIPYARGNSRSLDEGHIIKQVQKLIDKGYQEIILTGVDITSYGKDLNGTINLGILVKNIIKKTNNLKRLRISSIDSIEIDDDFLEVFSSEEVIMPHLHLSLQSGNDLILKRMLRRHQTSDAVKFCEKIQKIRPNSVFGADIIAGFPTETDDMHRSTMQHIDDCDITYLHVFPFSSKTIVCLVLLFKKISFKPENILYKSL